MRHKLPIIRSETYILLIAWASCAGRNFQDNINTEMEIQRRRHTVLEVKGHNLLTVRSHTYISCGQYLCSDR